MQVPLQWFLVRLLWSTFNRHGQGAIGSSIRSTTGQTWSYYGSVYPHHPSASLTLYYHALLYLRRYQRSNPVPLQKAPTLILTNYIHHESKWKFITLQIHLQILPIVAETELNSTKSSKSSDKACRFQAPVAFGPNTCRFQRLGGREWWVVKVGCCLCWCAVI